MITIKSNQYKLLIYIITVCHLLAGCSDDLFGGDESRGSGNRITLSGEIDQLAVTRVNDSGFADGDVMGVYIVDYTRQHARHSAAERQQGRQRAPYIRRRQRQMELCLRHLLERRPHTH